MDSTETKYDLIVVGLGCAGLSTAYYYSTQVPDAKILGLEMNSKSGDIGTSSFGDTRLFNHTPGFETRNEMLNDSLEMWKEIEEKSGKSIIHNKTMLVLGDKEYRFLKSAKEEYSEDKILSPTQISEKFPALENIPENYIGALIDHAGIVKSKLALNAYIDLCEGNGVSLVYDTKISTVSKNEVSVAGGATYSAEHVVVSTGPFTGDSFKIDDPNYVSIEQEFYEIQDKSGMPDLIIESESPKPDSFMGWVNGDGLENYKLGFHAEKNFNKVIEWVKNRIPSKLEELRNTPGRYQCKYWFNKDKHFVYETKDDGVHYLYGFKGHAFTYMPLHGKIVYDTLIRKNPLKYAKI